MVFTTVALAIALALAPVDPSPRGGVENEYELTFAPDLRSVQVEASVQVLLGRLEMPSFGAWSQSRRWASFVRGLEAHTTDGAALELEETPGPTWQLGENYSGRVRLTYRVDLGYAFEPGWPEGPRTTAAFSDGRAVALYAHALFVHSTDPTRARVLVEVPEGSAFCSPWSPLTEDGNIFTTDSLPDFARNMVVVGEFEEIELNAGGFDASIVALGAHRSAGPLMKPVALRIVQELRSYFADDQERRYLMVWFPDGDWETGEAHHDSYCAVWPETLSARNAVIWTDSITHELFHLWNGARIQPVDSAASQWFLEGFTEYGANLINLRAGVIEREDFYRLMEKHLLMYWMYLWNGPWERLSLVEAGSDKSDYNAALYDGGWVVAFCLDVLLREHSQGEHSLDDLMRTMNDEFGAHGIPYSNDDILVLASDLAGTDLAWFYRDHVKGTKRIDLREWLNRAGCDATLSGRAMIVHGTQDPNSVFERMLKGD